MEGEATGVQFSRRLNFERSILKMYKRRGGGTFKTQDWSSM